MLVEGVLFGDCRDNFLVVIRIAQLVCQTLTDLDSNAVFTLADNRADLPNASVLTQSELSDKITITLPSGTYRFKGE
jgi:hypothetical protein